MPKVGIREGVGVKDRCCRGRRSNFVGLFRLVEVEEIDWVGVEMSRDGWGEVFKQLVKGRRELVVGETRVRALPRGGLDVERKRLVFWSSLV